MLEELKALLRRMPFASFRMKVAGGEMYAVLSRYQIAVGRTQLSYYHPRSDRKVTVPLNRLVVFEVDAPPPAAVGEKMR